MNLKAKFFERRGVASALLAGVVLTGCASHREFNVTGNGSTVQSDGIIIPFVLHTASTTMVSNPSIQEQNLIRLYQTSDDPNQKCIGHEVAEAAMEDNSSATGKRLRRERSADEASGRKRQFNNPC